jgi:hypothetical protein
MEAQANNKEDRGQPVEDKKGPLGIDYEAEDVFAGAEPWEPIETKLVVGSFIAAFFFLALFATLIHIYILK